MTLLSRGTKYRKILNEDEVGVTNYVTVWVDRINFEGTVACPWLRVPANRRGYFRQPCSIILCP